jgi:glycosyltransferase involved in cell wall biosynthesis
MNNLTGARKILVILYGDIDFDGRVKRILEIAQSLGDVRLIDAATRPASMSNHTDYEHQRVVLQKTWSPGRRHLTFWRFVLDQARIWQPELIFAEDFFTTLPGWLAAKRSAAKLVYDAHELMIPELGKPISRRQRFWYTLERLVAPRANLVIAANPERAGIMAEHYSLKQTPTYMRNIPEPREVTPEQREAALRAYPVLQRNNSDDRIILYQGDVSLSRGLDRFVAALDYLPPNMRLVIAGTGPDMDRLVDLAKDHAKEGRFVALGRVPFDVLPAVTQLADIGIVTYPYDGLNNIYCAPNKIFEYVQAGLPVISTDQPPLRNIIEAYEIGILVTNNEVPSEVALKIYDAIQRIDTLCTKQEHFLSGFPYDSESTRVLDAVRKFHN